MDVIAENKQVSLYQDFVGKMFCLKIEGKSGLMKVSLRQG